MLTPHRRHLKSCEHIAKGWNFTLCGCPVWCDGTLDGRRFTRSLQTRNWERALTRIAALERGVDIGIELQPGRTVTDAVTGYLKDCRARNLKASSLNSRTRTFEFLKTAVGIKQVSGVGLAELEQHLDARRLPDNKTPIAPRTKRKEIEHIRSLWEWCVRHKWCDANVARLIRPPKVEDIATLPFTAAEVQDLLTACDQITSCNGYVDYHKRARALVLTLLYSGLRVGDVAQLKRSALEPTGHLVIRVMKTGVRLKVLLHKDAVQALKALPADDNYPVYFFWTGNGDVNDCSGNLRETVARVGKVAGIHAHPHRFRDTFAVQLLTHGADMRTVQMLLGHQSIRTTELHYAHFVPEHQQILDDAITKLDFSQKSTGPVLVRATDKRLRNAKR